MLANIRVIIPYYRAKDMVKGTLNSLLQEGIDPGHIFLVDDFSNDGIKDTLEKDYPGINYSRNSSNEGAAHSRNMGVRQADSR